MLQKRWWDVAVVAGCAATAAAIAFGLVPVEAVEGAVAYGAILAFALTYLVIARPTIGRAASPARFAVFLAAVAVVLVIGTAASGFLAILQALAYPMTWVLGDTRRRGVIGSGVIAVSVLAGYMIGGGFTVGATLAGLATTGFSFVFATALGLWITGIAEAGEERGRLLDELTAAQSEVRALSRERGASEERERLARDIHDTLAQSLTGLVILAERAGRQSREGESDAAGDTIATVEQVAREALAEARALVARTAAVPDEAALGAAIERLAERFRAQAGAAIAVSVDAAAEAMDRDRQVVLLRCAQEGLSNVARHAQAESVTVAVRGGEGVVTLEITDDGRGFAPAATGAGFGIDGMGDRVALAGGTFEVDSAPGAGTTVRVRLPLDGPGAPRPAADSRSEVAP
ncbi:sensor histidine kinase [Microbacterium sp. HJ5]